jgi:cytosine/adenosine deaminase-related metal-dependent hydrolase
LPQVVALGTDNVMLNSPNMLSEMKMVSKALVHDDGQVFKMCTLNGAKLLGVDRSAGSIDEGRECRVMVIDERSNNMWGSSDPLASVVRRARPSDILAIF